MGSLLRAKLFRTGGGAAGNVAAGTVSQLLGGLSGVESVFNPLAAEGGADGESTEQLSRRGPGTIRHRGRAVLPVDFEIMAREASPAVAVARVLPARDPGNRLRPGWITLIVIPRSDEPRPWPSFRLREHIRKFLEARGPANTSFAHRLHVTGPDYWEVGVDATVAPVNAESAGEAETSARKALERFLHPLLGGPNDSGWLPGRNVYLSDLAAVLERAGKIDYVRELTMIVDGVPQGETVRVPEGRFVVAGTIRIRIAF
jgi:predicted phage baseplate assembly protein